MRRDLEAKERLPVLRNPSQFENPGATARGCYPSAFSFSFYSMITVLL